MTINYKTGSGLYDGVLTINAAHFTIGANKNICKRLINRVVKRTENPLQIATELLIELSDKNSVAEAIKKHNSRAWYSYEKARPELVPWFIEYINNFIEKMEG